MINHVQIAQICQKIYFRLSSARINPSESLDAKRKKTQIFCNKQSQQTQNVCTCLGHNIPELYIKKVTVTYSIHSDLDSYDYDIFQVRSRQYVWRLRYEGDPLMYKSQETVKYRAMSNIDGWFHMPSRHKSVPRIMALVHPVTKKLT